MESKDKIILGNKETKTIKNFDGLQKYIITESTSIFEKNRDGDYCLVSEHTEYIK